MEECSGEKDESGHAQNSSVIKEADDVLTAYGSSKTQNDPLESNSQEIIQSDSDVTNSGGQSGQNQDSEMSVEFKPEISEVKDSGENDHDLSDEGSDLDEGVDDLDLEVEPEVLGEELVDSILRKGNKSAASIHKSRMDSALSNIDETEEMSEPSVAEETRPTVEFLDVEKRPATCGEDTEPPLSRAKLNTPASTSAYTDFTLELRNLDSRDTNRTHETREAVFRRALTLMSNRCTSVNKENTGQFMMPSSLISIQEPPFGVNQPQYFYIKQTRPSPMAPLKAWRGYNGNVYFEPISITAVGNMKVTDPTAQVQAAQLRKQDSQFRPSKVLTRPSSTPPGNASRKPLPRSAGPTKVRGNRPVALLDRRSVLANYNPNAQQELAWIEGCEDTGSLAMRPMKPSSREAKPAAAAASNREKIVKGSVAQRLRGQKRSGKTGPSLGVSGDKFSPVYTLSPLLRTQTQYSHSNQRMTMNSPDPHHAVYDHLPPLDQIRASLRHMDHMDSISEPSSNRISPYNRKVTLTEELKPFIKYSPEIKAKYQRQVQYLT